MTQEKRINIRLTPEEFQQFDDLRHAQRTSWQNLLMDYLRSWHSEHAANAPARQQGPSETSAGLSDGWSKEEATAARTLVEMMRAGDTVSAAVATVISILIEHWRKARRKADRAGA